MKKKIMLFFGLLLTLAMVMGCQGKESEEGESKKKNNNVDIVTPAPTDEPEQNEEELANSLFNESMDSAKEAVENWKEVLKKNSETAKEGTNYAMDIDLKINSLISSMVGLPSTMSLDTIIDATDGLYIDSELVIGDREIVQELAIADDGERLMIALPGLETTGSVNWANVSESIMAGLSEVDTEAYTNVVYGMFDGMFDVADAFLTDLRNCLKYDRMEKDAKIGVSDYTVTGYKLVFDVNIKKLKNAIEKSGENLLEVEENLLGLIAEAGLDDGSMSASMDVSGLDGLLAFLDECAKIEFSYGLESLQGDVKAYELYFENKNGEKAILSFVNTDKGISVAMDADGEAVQLFWTEKKDASSGTVYTLDSATGAATPLLTYSELTKDGVRLHFTMEDNMEMSAYVGKEKIEVSMSSVEPMMEMVMNISMLESTPNVNLEFVMNYDGMDITFVLRGTNNSATAEASVAMEGTKLGELFLVLEETTEKADKKSFETVTDSPEEWAKNFNYEKLEDMYNTANEKGYTMIAQLLAPFAGGDFDWDDDYDDDYDYDDDWSDTSSGFEEPESWLDAYYGTIVKPNFAVDMNANLPTEDFMIVVNDIKKKMESSKAFYSVDQWWLQFEGAAELPSEEYVSLEIPEEDIAKYNLLSTQENAGFTLCAEALKDFSGAGGGVMENVFGVGPGAANDIYSFPSCYLNGYLGDGDLEVALEQTYLYEFGLEEPYDKTSVMLTLEYNSKNFKEIWVSGMPDLEELFVITDAFLTQVTTRKAYDNTNLDSQYLYLTDFTVVQNDITADGYCFLEGAVTDEDGYNHGFEIYFSEDYDGSYTSCITYLGIE